MASNSFGLDRPVVNVIYSLLLCGCSPALDEATSPGSVDQPDVAAGASDDSEQPAVVSNDEGGQDEYLERRKAMVAGQLASRDIRNKRVLRAMQRVPRHKFVPKAEIGYAYNDTPLPIGHGQTISQPYVVALMTQLVDPQPTDKALDIGTGSGYQAAVLAELVDSVYTIEIVEPLAAESKKRLASLGYKNVHVRQGDGYRGWPEKAPFDVIIVAAAPDHIPQPLIDQLAPGGTMVIPVGNIWQSLIRIEKDEKGVVKKSTVAPVAFVPMTGEAQE